MDNQISAQNIIEDGDIEKYRRLSDAACKQLLGDKLILACILKSCIPEFKDCSVSDIESRYIEGEPDIGTVGVHPETTNVKTNSRIQGLSNESASESEGRITYDIRFCATTPRDKRLKLIINIEAQNNYYPGYPLIKRAFYYLCRQISAQYGSVFEKSDYGAIQKVYTIWICLDPPAKRKNTITAYRFTENCIAGNAVQPTENYDLGQIYMICLGSEKDGRYTGLLRLLDVFMSKSSKIDEKSRVLKDEFDAEIPDRLSEKECNMGGYSEYIENYGYRRGIKEGRAEGKAEGVLKGKSEGFALAVANLMKKLKMSIDDAMNAVDVPKNDRDLCRSIVIKMQNAANSAS